jgi:hypothetical protein
MDESGEHHVKQSKSGLKGQSLHVFPHAKGKAVRQMCTSTHVRARIFVLTCVYIYKYGE